VSTPRSGPGARGDERRVGGHHVTIGQPLRTLRSTRGAHFFHDHLRRLAWKSSQAAAFMIIYKTSSTEAPASTVPLAIRPDSTSPFWARSDQMRRLFPSSSRARGKAARNCEVGVFTGRSLEYDCSARACGPDEPGGDPGGPGGEAQRPDGGYTAWTERATKSPAWEKG